MKHGCGYEDIRATCASTWSVDAVGSSSRFVRYLQTRAIAISSACLRDAQDHRSGPSRNWIVLWQRPNQRTLVGFSHTRVILRPTLVWTRRGNAKYGSLEATNRRLTSIGWASARPRPRVRQTPIPATKFQINENSRGCGPPNIKSWPWRTTTTSFTPATTGCSAHQLQRGLQRSLPFRLLLDMVSARAGGGLHSDTGTPLQDRFGLLARRGKVGDRLRDLGCVGHHLPLVEKDNRSRIST